MLFLISPKVLNRSVCCVRCITFFASCLALVLPSPWFPRSVSMSRVLPLMNLHRERERHLYFSVVTGTHYGTKTSPDQQPTKLCAGVSADIDRGRSAMILELQRRVETPPRSLEPPMCIVGTVHRKNNFLLSSTTSGNGVERLFVCLL